MILRELLAKAHETDEPQLVRLTTYQDDRGFSLMNLFTDVLDRFVDGQVNFTTSFPGVVKAWHRHEMQTDLWLPVRGTLKCGVLRNNSLGTKVWSYVLGERSPGILIIPPGLWHGYAVVGHEPGSMVYFVNREYNATSPDEERASPDMHERVLPGQFTWETVNR